MGTGGLRFHHKEAEQLALDPQAQTLLEAMAAIGGPQLWTLEPQQAREQMIAMRQPIEKPDVHSVEDRNISGPRGDIPVRIYKPGASGGYPILVFYHGGGWVIGDIEYADLACRNMCNDAGCVVVSVDYRLAPEHKFPAPLDDCYAALQWAASNAASIGGDASRIAVGGDSAGGNLAAAVAIKARDQGLPKIRHQLLVYPVTNHSYDTPSYSANGEGYMLTKDAMVWFWDHYLNNEAEGKNPLASPLQVADTKGLPPATVITAEFDPLRDEGEAYAAKLKEGGVPVAVKRFDGQIHGFFHMANVLDGGKEAVSYASKQLKAAFGS